SPQDLSRYYQFGAIFENYVIADAQKTAFHRGKRPNFSFYRDSHGNEVDLVQDRATKAHLWEIKATQTYHARLAKTLHKVALEWDVPTALEVIYSGAEELQAQGALFRPWHQIAW
ncbi:MAG: DUF4143 domain-containing protein, partial [Bacteroidota bacterium]